jgi:hypothetical protein
MQKHLVGVSALNRDFNALLKQNAKRAEAETTKLRAQALKLARARQPLLATMPAQFAGAQQALPDAVDVPSATRHWVSTPIEVVGVGLNFDSFAAEEFRSFAKTRHTWTKTGGAFPQAIHPAVIFRYVWENTSDQYVVINVNGFVILHGFCDIWSDGGIFGGARAAGIQIKPTMQLFNWTTEPYLSLGSTDVVGVEMSVDTGTTWDDPDSDAKDVFRSYELSRTLILVPPRTAVGVVLSAQMRVYAGRNSGRVRMDFSTGNYQVGCPGALVTVVS